VNGNVSKATVPTPAGADARQPLDEVMLAMDIVDTIRRRERMVQRELDAEGREIDLKERLRKIYAAQGIDIPDHVLEQGVAAIKEDRFVYTPAAPGFPRTLATLYVTRNAWGKWLLGAIAAVMIAAAGYYAAVVAPAARLPGRIEALHAQIAGITEDAEARTQAGQIREAGLAAARRGERDQARSAIASLEALHQRLEQIAVLRRVEGQRIETLHAQIAGIIEDAEARTQAGQIRDAGLAAVQRGDAGKARAAVASLEALHQRLEQMDAVRRVEGQRIETLHAQIAEIAQEPEARTQAGQIREAGLAAVQRGDAGNARAAVASLEELLGLLEQDYTLRVVNRPGEYSGVYRIPDLNEQARNYYVIVEAIDSRGNVLTVPILSEETGATERVKAWGLRVDEDVFNAVANDMKDDGIIQNNRFGEKKRGRLTADYTMPTTGAAITAW